MTSRIDIILRKLREHAHPVDDTRPPDYELRDVLHRFLRDEYPAMTPDEDERACIEIRRLTRV